MDFRKNKKCTNIRWKPQPSSFLPNLFLKACFYPFYERKSSRQKRNSIYLDIKKEKTCAL